MLFQLVKKDFLIVKKYVLIMFAVCIFFPLFLIWRSPDNDFFHFHAFTICIFERNAISESVHFAVRFAVFTKKYCTVKIYFLYINILCLLPDFLHGDTFVSTA